MNTRHYILFYLFLCCSYATVFSNSEFQIKAEKAYSEKNYKVAIQNYEAILKEGLSSYKLYYNLGNAYYKNKELGKAIYNYELANKLSPNQSDVKNNLRIASEKTIDKIESKENFFISAIKSGLVNSFSNTGWAWLSILSLTTMFVLAFLFYISPKTIIKRISFFLSGVFLILFIAFMILGYASKQNSEELDFAIIINKESKIYEEPNSLSKSKFSLHEGTKVSVLETNKEWTNIKLENGNEGWIKTTEVGLF